MCAALQLADSNELLHYNKKTYQHCTKTYTGLGTQASANHTITDVLNLVIYHKLSVRAVSDVDCVVSALITITISPNSETTTNSQFHTHSHTHLRLTGPLSGVIPG